MPEIARFYGIIIKIYFNDHNPPYFHAYYGEYDGAFDIQTLEMIYGDLPKKAQELVREWAEQYREKIMEMWKTKKIEKLPSL